MESFMPQVFMVYLRTLRQCVYGKLRKEEGHKGSVDMESFVPHVFMVYLRTQRQCGYGKLHAPCVYDVP